MNYTFKDGLKATAYFKSVNYLVYFNGDIYNAFTGCVE